VLQRHVHTQPGLGGVSVACIAGDEDPWGTSTAFSVVDIVKLTGDALADFVHTPPRHVFDIELVRPQYLLGRPNNVLKCEPTASLMIVRVQIAQVNIKAN